LKDEYGWGFVDGPSGRKQEYLHEYLSMESRYQRAAAQILDDMDGLKRQLASNIWVNERDSAGITNRYAARQQTLGQIDDMLRSVSFMLELVADP
jgi:hypothetical protein